MPRRTTTLGEKLKNDPAVREAAPELLKALNEMVFFSSSRATNDHDRAQLARRYIELGRKYRPLLARLGASRFVESTPQPYAFCTYPDFDEEEVETSH